MLELRRLLAEIPAKRFAIGGEVLAMHELVPRRGRQRLALDREERLGAIRKVLIFQKPSPSPMANRSVR